jgi:hypothetical protein
MRVFLAPAHQQFFLLPPRFKSRNRHFPVQHDRGYRREHENNQKG